MKNQSILDIEVSRKRLLIRADLNVPINDGKITDDTRIKRFCQGMLKLLQKGAKLIIVTHMGRPKGIKQSTLSTKILINSLEKYLGKEAVFSDNCIEHNTIEISKSLKDHQILLCENLRFYKEEEENDLNFAKQLSLLGDYFVNDAFSCSHRAHASTEGITKFIPSFSGPMLNEEISALKIALESPKKPSLAIIGGAKVSSKISVLKNLVSKLDGIIIGGGMANTFLFAKGAPMGKSMHESNYIDTVFEIENLAKKNKCNLYLPLDVVVAGEFKEDAPNYTIPFNQCPKESMILDVGENSIQLFKEVIEKSKTVLWNGPLGAFEIKPFNNATKVLANFTATMTKNKQCISVAGGGDTLSALNSANASKEFTYVSSAGGAFLEWLEGKELPGIRALRFK